MIFMSEVFNFFEKNNIDFKYTKSSVTSLESFCPIGSLKNNSITWIRDVVSFDFSTLDNSENLVIICNEFDRHYISDRILFVFVHNPHSVFFSILDVFFANQSNTKKNSIGATSIVKSTKIGVNVSIGEHCFICEDVEIGDNVTIANNVSIECKTIIGHNTKIYSGAVIGTDGYGFYENINGQLLRVPHLGGVIIGNNVEIGACTCIAKGCLGDTVISDYVKIDNLCHIAHNVFIDRNSNIVAQSLLAGSSVIGKNVWIAPCSCVKNQVIVGDNALIGMGAVVIADVESNKVVAGVPAKVLRDNIL